MSCKLPLALIALAVFMLVGCKQPIGVPSDVHAATTYYINCNVLQGADPTGYLRRWEGPPDYFWWYEDTISVCLVEDHGLERPRKNGVCFFMIPPFNCDDAVPTCTLVYHQMSHEEAGEGESLLVNVWDAQVQWPPIYSYERAIAWWAIYNSTCTLAVDVIHEDDGEYRVPLDSLACQMIGDSGCWYHENDPDGYATIKTGWVYHGSTSNTHTDIAGHDDASHREPYIKVVYEGSSP